MPQEIVGYGAAYFRNLGYPEITEVSVDANGHAWATLYGEKKRLITQKDPFKHVDDWVEIGTRTVNAFRAAGHTLESRPDLFGKGVSGGLVVQIDPKTHKKAEKSNEDKKEYKVIDFHFIQRLNNYDPAEEWSVDEVPYEFLAQLKEEVSNSLRSAGWELETAQRINFLTKEENPATKVVDGAIEGEGLNLSPKQKKEIKEYVALHSFHQAKRLFLNSVLSKAVPIITKDVEVRADIREDGTVPFIPEWQEPKYKEISWYKNLVLGSVKRQQDERNGVINRATKAMKDQFSTKSDAVSTIENPSLRHVINWTILTDTNLRMHIATKINSLMDIERIRLAKKPPKVEESGCGCPSFGSVITVATVMWICAMLLYRG